MRQQTQTFAWPPKPGLHEGSAGLHGWPGCAELRPCLLTLVQELLLLQGSFQITEHQQSSCCELSCRHQRCCHHCHMHWAHALGRQARAQRRVLLRFVCLRCWWRADTYLLLQHRHRGVLEGACRGCCRAACFPGCRGNEGVCCPVSYV